jgi:hypothetical protein
MTAKEKAKELVDKYYHLFSVELENTICIYEAKHCALIAVDEILKEHYPQDIKRCDYFMEVKQEIEKL